MVRAVTPLICGSLVCDPSAMDAARTPGREILVPVVVWLLEYDDELVLFDAGGSSIEMAFGYGHLHYRLEEEESIDQKLQSVAGISPADIGTVVLSHLHWDHASNLSLFTSAQIHVQRKEFDYAREPGAADRTYFDTAADPPVLLPTDQLVLGRGVDTSLGPPGLSLITLPGHTPGSQGLLIEGRGVRLVATGDTVPFFSNYYWGGPRPNSVRTHPADAVESIAKLQSLDALVLPGHDPELVAFEGQNLLDAEVHARLLEAVEGVSAGSGDM